MGLLSVPHPKSSLEVFPFFCLITLKKVLTFMSLCFKDIKKRG